MLRGNLAQEMLPRDAVCWVRGKCLDSSAHVRRLQTLRQIDRRHFYGPHTEVFLPVATADLYAPHLRCLDLSASLTRRLRRPIGAGDICSIGRGFGIAFGWLAHWEIVKSVGLRQIAFSERPLLGEAGDNVG